MAMAADSADFDDFYAATSPVVIRQVYALTGDLEEARDIMQEAYARAWNRWASLQTYESPAGWVRTVAHRLAISHWRRGVARAAAYRRHGTPHDAPSPSSDVVLLVEALRTLPVKQRHAVVLHYLADLSVEQVATELGAPVGSVKGWLSRGRAALAAVIGTDDQPAGATGRDRS